MKAQPPSQRLHRNLTILVIARAGYFTSKGLSPALLVTLLAFVKKSNRIPAAKLVLPILFSENSRKTMARAIREQGDEWEQPEVGKSSWTYFCKLGISAIQNQQVDDLLQLDYPALLHGLEVPNMAKVSLFWGGLTDFLVNSWSILEELRLASSLAAKMEKEAEELPQKQSAREATRLIGWADMQFEHHLLNAILRLRAGWDKLANYLLMPYYGIPNISSLSWPKRLGRLDRELSGRLDAKQEQFWKNILENARMIAEPSGLRDVRDFELHKIAQRSRETLGDKERAHPLRQLESFAVTEHHRLQDSFLLFLALVLSGPRSQSQVG